jgi:small-conductance mechanosensitive channel
MATEMVTTIRTWVNELTKVGISLLALTVVLQVAFGQAVPFMPVDVIGNITTLVATLGSQGLVGLVALGVLYAIFQKKDA